MTSRSKRVPTDASPDDPEFESAAAQAEEEALLEKELEDTFPSSDPPSDWAGKDPGE
jgi:hypothetical protein